MSGVICVRVGATGGTAQAEQCANQVKEARLKLFRHGGRRVDLSGQRMLKMELLGRRKR